MQCWFVSYRSHALGGVWVCAGRPSQSGGEPSLGSRKSIELAPITSRRVSLHVGLSAFAALAFAHPPRNCELQMNVYKHASVDSAAFIEQVA